MMDNTATDFAANYQAYSTFDVDLAKAALVIIDMQNSFCDPESDVMSSAWAVARLEGEKPDVEWWTKRMRDTVIPNNQRLVSVCREAGLRTVYAVMGYWSEDGSEFSAHMRDRLRVFKTTLGKDVRGYQFGRRGTEVIQALAPRRDEVVLKKVTSSAFTSTGIDVILRNMGIEYLFITGQNTDGCVLYTSIDARDRGYRLTLVSDACVTLDKVKHEMILSLFEANWGRVCTTEEVIREIREKSL
jgi:nicotinamidase-related amidase